MSLISVEKQNIFDMILAFNYLSAQGMSSSWIINEKCVNLSIFIHNYNFHVIVDLHTKLIFLSLSWMINEKSVNMLIFIHNYNYHVIVDLHTKFQLKRSKTCRYSVVSLSFVTISSIIHEIDVNFQKQIFLWLVSSSFTTLEGIKP